MMRSILCGASTAAAVAGVPRAAVAAASCSRGVLAMAPAAALALARHAAAPMHTHFVRHASTEAANTRADSAAAAASSADAAAAASASPNDAERRSITQLVADVLRSGPKTRAQIFFAINKGPPMARKPPQAANPNRPPPRKNLINQHPKPALHTFQQIQKKQADMIARAREVAAANVEPYEEIEWPSGPLRSPTHLTHVLQAMMDGKRLYARPFKSIAPFYGEKEAASVQAILEPLEASYLAKREASLLAEGKSPLEVKEMLVHSPRISARMAGPQAPKAHGRAAQQYVYVLRDWSDARYEARAPILIARGAEKKARRAALKAIHDEEARPETQARRKREEYAANQAKHDAEAAERMRMWRAHALNMNEEEQHQFLEQKRREDEEDEAEAARQ
jgi:hypothetical protein